MVSLVATPARNNLDFKLSSTVTSVPDIDPVTIIVLNFKVISGGMAVLKTKLLLPTLVGVDSILPSLKASPIESKILSLRDELELTPSVPIL